MNLIIDSGYLLGVRCLEGFPSRVLNPDQLYGCILI